MKVAEVLSCSFPKWYEQFKHVTYKSIILPLPQAFLDYLNTDSIVLPESSTHGLYPVASNIVMNEDEDDPDLRDEDLMKQYEADWSTPLANQTENKFPEMKEFEALVASAIKDLGGRVFPKLNWSSPKDATWVSFDKSLMCTCPSDVYLLLKSSEFVSHDTDMPFSGCSDLDPTTSDPAVEYCLVLREWHPPDLATEFRCFVHEGQLVGICQRHSTKFYPFITKEKQSIMQDIVQFFKRKVLNSFQLPSYVFDVVRPKPGCVQLVDFNPFGPVTDGIMFTWEELPTLVAVCDCDEQGTKVPQFRCVESEEGVRSADYANYAFPLDIQDLVAGRDPDKFLDLMKMKIQSAEGDDSSSDEEDHQQGELTLQSQTTDVGSNNSSRQKPSEGSTSEKDSER